ncbi:TerB family tellurite resistance protein [Mucilaginibacter ginsenosidivorans]|uniref:TerB family tellurite resistance protein n=2 Tax=Mucilaginibacter ginsenosidivorans TaxID=398053 RepID=A0A5B8V2N4_9SPHI|nr:TerB family tellurite resistance protein [Mucilaginibacter ginsenosidivorans]
MKKRIKTLLLTAIIAFGAADHCRAQSVADCIRQLALDYQKLASLKSILGQMYTGYDILSKGYRAVKDVSQGNFSLHEAFLNGLFIVNPTVRKYPRVEDIINDQAMLVSEYKTTWSAYQSSGKFSPDELSYMIGVYNNLVDATFKNLNDLAMVLGDGQLRMSDAERLGVIDRIYLDSKNELSYLRKFNDQAGRTLAQRKQAQADKQIINSLYGLNP